MRCNAERPRKDNSNVSKLSRATREPREKSWLTTNRMSSAVVGGHVNMAAAIEHDRMVQQPEQLGRHVCRANVEVLLNANPHSDHAAHVSETLHPPGSPNAKGSRCEPIIR